MAGEQKIQSGSTQLLRAVQWADLVLKVLSALAIVVGAGWTWWTFIYTRSDADNVTVSLSVDQPDYASSGLKLLVIHVKPKNAGRTLFKPKGYTVSVQQLPLDGAQWKALDVRDKLPLTKIDLLSKNKGYDIEPGVEYDDLAMVPVPNNVVVLVRAEIVYGDGTSFIDAHEVRKISDRR